MRCRYGVRTHAAEAWSPLQRGASGIGGSRRDRRACSRARKLAAGGCVTRPKWHFKFCSWICPLFRIFSLFCGMRGSGREGARRVAAGQGGGRAAWGVYARAKAAPRRPGCRARAARVRGRRSTRSGGGCRTGDVEKAASASGTQGACDAAAGALADILPLRQARERRPYRSGCGRLPPSGSDWHRPQGLPRWRS